MLGLFSFNLFGSSGALYQMLAHGLSTGALFLLVGMIYERRHTREISEFGGLATGLPFFTFAFVFVTLASVGLPGLNGFVGEFLVLLGAFGENRWMAVLAASGVVLGAIYMLWLVRRFLFGPLTNEANANLPDLNVREWFVLVPILGMIVVMGVLPRPFLSRMEPSLEAALAPLQAARTAAEAREPADLGSIELPPAIWIDREPRRHGRAMGSGAAIGNGRAPESETAIGNGGATGSETAIGSDLAVESGTALGSGLAVENETAREMER
jgi:NADH-quinone oxidoreductase subunit M